MFHSLYPLLSDDIGALRLFSFITFRTGGAIMTALIISLLFGDRIIAWLKTFQVMGQPIRDDGPAHHLVTKAGTPTMGGVLILLSVTVSTLLWADLSNGFVWIVLLVALGFGALGLVDDYLKVSAHNSKGPRRANPHHRRSNGGSGCRLRDRLADRAERSVPRWRCHSSRIC